MSKPAAQAAFADSVSFAAPALSGNIDTLRQLQEQLASLSPVHYRCRLDASISSIGAHVRHIIDHYHCFFRDLAGGVIDYDSRPKARSFETELHLATQALRHYELRFSTLNNLAKSSALAVSGHSRPDGAPQRADTSAARELLFLQSHTLHHMAIIRLLLHLQGIHTPDMFGASPATLRSPAASVDRIDLDFNA